MEKERKNRTRRGTTTRIGLTWFKFNSTIRIFSEEKIAFYRLAVKVEGRERMELIKK